MGACYSSNKIETTNSSTKRPYDKSVKTKTKSNLLNSHPLTSSYYLATISNNQLIQINNQIHALKPKNSIVDESKIQINKSTKQFPRMYENNKSKLVSKLPKFNSCSRVHDSSSQPSKIGQFATHTIGTGIKQTLNADLLRIKNGIDNRTNGKSSTSSLTNSEISCGSSSNSSHHSTNRKTNFAKATSSSTLNDRRKVISKQPTKSISSLNQYSSSNHRLNCSTAINTKPSSQSTVLTNNCSSSLQFSQALTKLPSTSKFTTTITHLPKPQIAQRLVHPHRTNVAATKTVNSQLDCQQQSRKSQILSTLRPYSLKTVATDSNHLHKKPYTRITTSQRVNNVNNTTFRYSYPEPNLKTTRLSFGSGSQQVNEDKLTSKTQLPSNKKLISYSGLPVPSNCNGGNLRTSKNELRDICHSPSSVLVAEASSNEHLLQQTSKSLTLDDNQLNSEKENKRLSTSFESSSFLNNKTSPTAKELSDRINQVKSFNKLLNHHQTNNHNLQSSILRRQQIRTIQQSSNSVETTDDSNSIHEQLCVSSQKSNSPNASLTPDLSNTSKISPEHNNRSENQIYLDDEISDQPGLLFFNSKENSTTTSPVKENVNLIDNLMTNGLQDNYHTNIRYNSISELDSLKLKQELLMSSPLKIDDMNNVDNQLASSVSSSPEKSTSLSSPVRSTTFRKPMPLSYVESQNGSLALDNSSFRSVLQDINGIKTLLFRLQGELQKSETQNPFENILNASQTKDQNSNSDELSKDRCVFLMNDEQSSIRNESLEIENQNLKKQLALMQQKMDNKDRTIRLLQQQMTKYLNINETTANIPTTQTSNSATQTERCIDYNKTMAPQEQKTSNGIVVSGKVLVDGEIKTSIEKGISLLIGFTRDDTEKEIDFMAKKVVDLRLFDNEEKNRAWDLNVRQKNYEILCISQFTLYGKLKGNRLDFHHAMATDKAEDMYNKFVAKVKEVYNKDKVKDGLFGLYRDIQLSIDGPVTINLSTDKKEETDQLKD